VLVGTVLLATRLFPGARAHLTIGLGVAAGVGALVAVTTFAARDAPSGRVAWLQIAVGVVIGAVLAGLLVALRGRRRVHAAGIVGGIAAAASLGSLPVFWHGVVISALPATPTRLACGIAFVGGVAAAALSFLPDFDEDRAVGRAPRVVRR
jgi:predicted membrane-bound spermidine synthase